ncbi:MAG: hypothetical protein ABIO55_03045 [Ginsengibacter sp.]
MNLQKFGKTLLIVLCISLSLPAFSNPVNTVSALSGIPGNSSGKTVDQILIRLQEIKDMNKENLSRSEKKDLRNEVKEMRKELKADKKNGIYLSIGAVIIIILLLILLL